MIKDFDTIVYHSPCSDGTASLWAAEHYKSINNKVACKAGYSPNEEFINQNILFVDLCPRTDYLLKLSRNNNNIVILDHHKSAYEMIYESEEIKEINNINTVFDMDRAGCQITWDYFFPDLERPFFIDYIADRDLWKWKLRNSREINATLFEANIIDHTNLQKLNDLLIDSEIKKNKLITEGEIILRSNKREIEVASKVAIESIFNYENNDYKVWLAGNISPGLRSELGNYLLDKKFKDETLPDFCATWQYFPPKNEWWISLRGNENSPDLSKIAFQLDGGGHKTAAGFTIKNKKGLKKHFIYK